LQTSLITALYNAEKTIEQSMLSINGQTYQNLEHIIIDCRSTDQSLDMVKRLSSSKTKVISEDDLEIYDALNKGIGYAQGDVIGFVHSDDFFTDNTVLEKIARAFEEHQAEAVFSDLDYVSKKTQRTSFGIGRLGNFRPKN
jgi:glycosyltransferase